MIVAVDIDHTLSHAAWRDEHIEWARVSNDWDYYHSLAKEDKPAKIIVDLVIALHNAGHEIYIVTARPRKWLRQTYAWLHNNGVLVNEDHILMRHDEDFHPATDLKMMLIDQLNIDLFIDDREDVAETVTEAGITSLQVRLVS